jgi:hypothetical protein
MECKSSGKLYPMCEVLSYLLGLVPPFMGKLFVMYMATFGIDLPV